MEQQNGQFSFLIDAVFQITGRGLVVCGLIERGSISVGDIVYIPHKGLHTVNGIEMFETRLDYAEEGDNVGLLFSKLKKDDVNIGERITSTDLETDKDYENTEQHKNYIIDSTEKKYNTGNTSIDVEKSNNDDSGKIENLPEKNIKLSDSCSFEQIPTPDSISCFNCGESIKKNFKHCPYCGIVLQQKKIIEDNSTKQYEPKKETNVEISLLGRTLIFTQNFMDYYKFKNRFIEFGIDLENKYIDFYNSSKHTFEGVFEEQLPAVIEKIEKIICFGECVLKEYGVDDVNGKEITDSISNELKKDFEYISRAMNEILEFDDSSAEFREKLFKYNHYWNGGGFGVKEAIIGAVQAEILDLGTNVLKNVVGNVKRAIDIQKAKKMQQEFAERTDIFNHLHNPIYTASELTFDFIYKQLVNKNIIQPYDDNTVETDEGDIFERYLNITDKVDTCVEKYDSMPHTNELYNDTIDTMCECLNEDPVRQETYLQLYRILIDGHEELFDFATLFGEQRYFKEKIIKYDLQQIDEIKKADDDTIEKVQSKISNLKIIIKRNPYINISEYISELTQKIELLENKEIEKNIQKSQEERIIDYKENVENALRFGDVEYLWTLTDSRNPYAEYILVSHYQELCVKKPYGYYTIEQKREILNEVEQKANNGNLLAIFVLVYLLTNDYAETTSELLKSCQESGYASPMYYIGHEILSRNKSYQDFVVEAAVANIKNSADMLFPAAIDYLEGLYKFGKTGVTTSNKDLAQKYAKLNQTYNSPALVSQIDDNSFIAEKIKKIENAKKCIDEALEKRDYDYILSEIENGNSYAEYVLECKTKISDITKKSDNKNIKNFADYVKTIREIEKYKSDQEKRENAMPQINKIMQIAKTGNISAIYQVGKWKMNRDYITTCMESTDRKDSDRRIAQEGVCLLEIAAKHLYPPALYYLGYSYYKGNYPLQQDIKLAKYYLRLSAAYGWQGAKDILNKINNQRPSSVNNQQSSSSSGGCFITSAVCKAFGKPDNCYELTMFRKFRDGWLSKQPSGNVLIAEYYKIAPIIVKNIDNKSNNVQIYNSIWENYLKECLLFIEKNKFEQCKKMYCKMVADLKNAYYLKGSCK